LAKIKERANGTVLLEANLDPTPKMFQGLVGKKGLDRGEEALKEGISKKWASGNLGAIEGGGGRVRVSKKGKKK